MQDEQAIQTTKANSLDKFKLGIKDMVDNMMIERMAKNDDIVTQYIYDKEVQSGGLVPYGKGYIREGAEKGDRGVMMTSNVKSSTFREAHYTSVRRSHIYML